MNCVLPSTTQTFPQFNSHGLRTTTTTAPASTPLQKFLARSFRQHSVSCISAKISEETEDAVPQHSNIGSSLIRFGAKTALIVALTTSVVHIDVATAYIGGGPYGRMVTRGQDLTGKDFSGLDLTQQDFKTSILRQCNFHGSKLLGASFFDADLTGADLSDSDLRGADFSLTNAQKANFTNAVFEGATVTGNTSFKNAIITGADFTDVLFREDQIKSLCKIASGTNPVTGNDTRETLFCR